MHLRPSIVLITDLCLANLKRHRFYSAFLVVIWVYFNTKDCAYPIVHDCFIMKAQENVSIKMYLCTGCF